MQVAWTDIGTSTETTNGVIDTDFDSVTNVLPIAGIVMKFVNLKVTGN